MLTAPTAALVAGPHLLVAPAVLGPVGSALGGVFHLFGGLVLGGLNWTVGVAGKFILNTLGGLIRLLIPASWAKDGLQVMHWIVAVPDYAGTITTPSGHVTYGFAGINALRDLFMWVGAALLPLTLVYATSRAALGAGHNVAAPVVRVLALAAVLVSYPWWWSQAAAAVNQITQFVLALPPVSHGVYKLMQYAVGGVALGGWQLIDLFLMGAIGFALLGLIFLKVVIILLGALLYAIGPLMIALVPTDGGIVIARAWASAALALLDAAAGVEHDPRGRRAADQRQLDRRTADRRPGIDREPARRPAARLRGARVAVAMHPRRPGSRCRPARPARRAARPRTSSRRRNRLRRSGAHTASRGIVAELRGTGRRRDRRSTRRGGTAGTGRGIRSPRVRDPQPARPTRRRRCRDPHRRTRRRARYGGARRSHPRRRSRRANGSRRHRKLADLEDPDRTHATIGRPRPILIALRARGGARPKWTGTNAPDVRSRPSRPVERRLERTSGSCLAASRACRTAKPRRSCERRRPDREDAPADRPEQTSRPATARSGE